QMPDLRGQTPTQARDTLRKLGWLGMLNQMSTPVDDTTQVGIVVAQDVPPAAGFGRDQTITITVGRDNTTTSPTTSSGIFGTPGLSGGG
ncbi:MAG: PASTA domain-containing protein, partial [Mycobacterium sp.]